MRLQKGKFAVFMRRQKQKKMSVSESFATLLFHPLDPRPRAETASKFSTAEIAKMSTCSGCRDQSKVSVAVIML